MGPCGHKNSLHCVQVPWVDSKFCSSMMEPLSLRVILSDFVRASFGL